MLKCWPKAWCHGDLWPLNWFTPGVSSGTQGDFQRWFSRFFFLFETRREHPRDPGIVPRAAATVADLKETNGRMVIRAFRDPHWENEPSMSNTVRMVFSGISSSPQTIMAHKMRQNNIFFLEGGGVPPAFSFPPLNYTIRHALVTETVNFQPIPIGPNF